MKPFNCVQTINSDTWNLLTVCKQMGSGLSKSNVNYKLLANKLYIYIYIYIYISFGFILPQKLICCKTQQNETKLMSSQVV